MVCSGPDPPDSPPLELRPPRPLEPAAAAGDDSDEDERDYAGYEQLPQSPHAPPPHQLNNHDDEEDAEEALAPPDNMPPIEPMEQVLTREVWSAPRPANELQMDPERAQQVMTAMANFVLPASAVPQWAQCVSEEQWRRTLRERLRLPPPRGPGGAHHQPPQ